MSGAKKHRVWVVVAMVLVEAAAAERRAASAAFPTRPVACAFIGVLRVIYGAYAGEAVSVSSFQPRNSLLLAV